MWNVYALLSGRNRLSEKVCGVNCSIIFMKCPYCGAEVVPNTICEYCDSFVEKETKEDSSYTEYQENLEKIIFGTAEHIADSFQESAEDFEDTIRKAASPENKRFVKKLIITISIVIGILVICFILFGLAAFRSTFSFMDEMYETYTVSEEATVYSDIRSLTDEEATVAQLNSDGTMTLVYEGNECDTKLTDETLLAWLNENDRTIDGVGVLFNTDSDGNVTSLALSSHTFFVIQQDNAKYLVLRQGDVFSTTSDVPLEVGNFYDGYFNYPSLNAHVVTSNSGNGYLPFDPVSEAKVMQNFTDPYTGEEYSLPMIYVKDAWYHCSQEIYDACTVGQVIPLRVWVDNSMGVVYTAE